MWIIILGVGLVLGLFGFSQIIYPLFVAWPKSKKLLRDGKLVKPIPVYTFILPALMWSLLIWGSIALVNGLFADYLKVYYIGLGFILLVVLAQIPKQNSDLEADFKDSWKKYLKDQ